MVELVRTESLRRYFAAEKLGLLEKLAGRKQRYIKAVDDVNVVLNKNETTALVGESGSGKTTLGRMLATLDMPTSGKIFYGGVELNEDALEFVRHKVQIVFQNPYESLDPRMSIRQIIEEALTRYGGDDRTGRVKEVLEAVGLNYSDIHYRKARDLSGGQRQRVAVARAMAASPEFIVLDEPTSALDASVQSQVLNLLVQLKKQYGYTYLFITHNMMVARYISDRIYIMYAGKVVEAGLSEEVFTDPFHPYTKLLMESVPSLEPTAKLEAMKGEAPSLLNPPPGCRFSPRCPYAFDRCFKEEPRLHLVGQRLVACHLFEDRERRNFRQSSFMLLAEKGVWRTGTWGPWPLAGRSC
ncbi:MAG: ATP-binding cassette domain-containing protein [TACK group archaeon]|nr:ATP-binding cassette domain-containing protein [TACK group archaeon]